MLTVAPATVIVPIRATAVLAAITKWRLVLPTPDAGSRELIHAASLIAAHWQPGVAVRATESSASAGGASTVDGETLYRQGAAAWLTSTVLSDTATCPRRPAPFGFGCTAYAIVACP